MATSKKGASKKAATQETTETGQPRAQSGYEGASKTQHGKEELPPTLEVKTVRRAVELAMTQGYFLAVSDQALYHSDGKKFQVEEVQRIFADGAILNLDPEIYEPIVADHVDSLWTFNGWDMVELCIKGAHNEKLSLGALAKANAAIKNYHGGKRGRISRKALKWLLYFARLRVQSNVSLKAALDRTAAEFPDSTKKDGAVLRNIKEAVNNHLGGGSNLGMLTRFFDKFPKPANKRKNN
jgi:hypothetical protein